MEIRSSHHPTKMDVYTMVTNDDSDTNDDSGNLDVGAKKVIKTSCCGKHAGNEKTSW